MTIATLLSGGEGVGVGARAAGLRHLWGIEIDDAVAGAARANGFNVITADIRAVDPRTLERPDILHASPECQNASNAKHDPGAETFEGKETELDRDIARCIVRYVEALEPRVVTLENVYGYRRFESFQIIMHALNRLGYFTHYANLNAADFGVPQTRRRLILRAVRGGLVPWLPEPEPWRGWYGAIEDLVPSLPESEFAPWQLARLPERLDESAVFSNQESNDHKGGSYGCPYRRSTEPALTVTGMSAGWHKAFIVPGGNSNSFSVRGTDEPARTVGDVGRTGNLPRAFILSNAATEWGEGVRLGDEPVHTVTEQSNGRTRAFIIDQNYGSPNTEIKRRLNIRGAEEPMFTVTAGENRLNVRAWLTLGRVVKMTPRCLARFQSFPDDYALPDADGLACKVVGNAVPPLMYQKLAAVLKEAAP